MILNRLRSLGRFALGALVVVLTTSALYAQSAPATASSGYDSRWDFSTLYSYLGVHGSDKLDPISITTIPAGGSGYTAIPYSSVNEGGYGGVTYFFNRHIGVEGAFASHDNGYNDGLNSIQFGPVYRFRQDHVTYFLHGLVGGIDEAGPNQDSPNDYHNPWTWGVGFTAGGGADYQLPRFKFLSIRIFQADYTYNKVNFGPSAATLVNVYPLGGRSTLNNAQLSTGLVWHFGSIAPPPAVTYSCSATPTSVFPGDPVTVTGSAANLNPKKTATYSWNSTSGPVTGSGSSITVSSKTPGSYTVTGHVSDGDKPYEAGSCTATFTVNDFAPPTVSCSANPSTINPGESSTITAMGSSPQNRPLTYSYSASAGSVSGSGSTATFSSSGAPSGTATITCNVVDDTGKSASATTTVSIMAPPPPPQPMAKALCSVSFDRDKARPTRVDNEAKACLDDITLALQQDPNAKLYIVGNQTAVEGKHKRTSKDAAERAANTKAYLVTDKGIDVSRISLYTGTDDAKSVTTTLVPSGATSSTDGLTPVDESMVKARTRKTIK